MKRIIILTVCFIFSFQGIWAQEGFHKKIDELILSNKLDKAEKIAREGYKKYPNNSEVICALACVYRNKARKSGITINTSAMGIKDGESGVYTIKDTTDLRQIISDQIYYDETEYMKAESLYYKIIKIDKEYRNAYFNLMNDYTTMGNFEKYFTIVDLFIENLKEFEDTPDYLLDQALKLNNENKIDVALRLYEKMIPAFPNRYEPLSDIGVIYIKKGDFYKACNVFKNVHGIEPSDPINLNNYIFCSIFIEDFSKAYELYNALAEIDKGGYNYDFDLGLLAYLINNDYKNHFNNYINYSSERIHPDSVQYNFWYMNAKQYVNIDTLNTDDKIEFFEYLLDQFQRANLHKMAIIQACIIENIKETNFSLNAHASIYDSFNFFEKTIKYLDKIANKRKTDESIITEYNLLSNYGRICFATGKYEKAISYWDKIFSEDQSNAFINHYLGLSYLNLGDTDKAKSLFVINSKLNDRDQMKYINYSIQELEKLK